MKVRPVKTHKITTKDKDIFAILDKYLPKITEGSVIAITSKIVAITEGRMVAIEKADKDKLIKQESQYYLPRNTNKYKVSYSITHNTLVASAGIDESNGNGYYILWPKDPWKSAAAIRDYIRKVRGIRDIGVIITDSRTTPMRWGVTGITIGYSGLRPLINYVGKKDLFGRKFEYETLSLIDCLASSAILVMGEGAEQAPIAIIADIPFVEWNDSDPTDKEIAQLKISPADDLYGPLLTSVKWKKGDKANT